MVLFLHNKGNKLLVEICYGTEIESVGIGLKYQYNITDQIRIEPSMNYFFKNDGLSMFDINANIHYLFPIASNISLYPLAGFTYTNWHLDLGKQAITMSVEVMENLELI